MTALEFEKERRARSERNLEITRRQPCIVCRKTPVDVHHIKTRGAGGSDELYNLLPVCRKHHNEIHNKGIRRCAEIYYSVRLYLETAGWTFDENGKLHNRATEVSHGVA